MLNIEYDILDKGIILIYDQGLCLSGVRASRDFKVVIKKPTQVHDLSVIIQNDVKDADIDWIQIIKEIKNQYGDNLLALLDLDGNTL